MPLTDKQVTALAVASRMIHPFIPRQVNQLGNGHKAISYGASSFGYDIRPDPEQGLFLAGLLTPGLDVVDPKAFNPTTTARLSLHTGPEGQWWELPGHSYALCSSVEYFRMPPYILGTCVGKSTYARCCVVVNITPLEPGWEGHLTIELANAGDSPVRIYANEGIAQVVFFEGDDYPNVTYDARNGKYQGQEGVTFAK